MVDLLVRSYVLVGAMLMSKRLGLLLGYITMGTICYSVMVKKTAIVVFSFSQTHMLDIIGRNDCLPSNTWRSH